MTEARYPFEVLWSDLALAIVGMALSVAVLLTGGAHGLLLWILGAFLASSTWFFYRTLKLYKTRILIGKDKLEWQVLGRKTSQHLDELSQLKLRFYGSRRQKVKGLGTYNLTLTFADGSSLFADQRLDEFQALIECVSKGYQTVDTDKITRDYLSLFRAS